MRDRMDGELLDTCSDEFSDAVLRLEEEIDEPNAFIPELAPAFYVLDRFNSEVVDIYLEEWPDKEWDSLEIVLEFPDSAHYLIELHENHPARYRDNRTEIDQIMSNFHNSQQTNGLFPNNHSACLWSIVTYGQYPDAIESGIAYFEDEIFIEEQKKYWPSELPYAILSLLELDYLEHRSQIHELANILDKQIREVLDSGEDSYVVESTTVEALSKIPGQNYECLTSLEDNLWAEIQREWDYSLTGARWFWSILGGNLVSMLARGHGPKVSKYASDWEEELEKQKHRRSKPDFVSTLPTTKLETRRHEIQDTARSMIKNASSSLRISSLFIDMLHDEIIDLIQSGVDVRILARSPKSASGERKKMKEAVIQELIRQGDGENVRDDQFLHSRLIISDDNEVLVSSADLTRDQLQDEYNAGIHTKDPETVESAIEFFDGIWDEASSLNVNE